MALQRELSWGAGYAVRVSRTATRLMSAAQMAAMMVAMMAVQTVDLSAERKV